MSIVIYRNNLDIAYNFSEFFNHFHMPDQFTEVTTVGYGKRIMDSIGGIFLGLILFIASFFVLYNNEGSVDYSQIAKTAVEIDSSSSTVDPALNGKLLVTSGNITTDDMVDDGQFLKPGKYLSLEKKVEMFAWEEKTSTQTQKNVGGSETKTTTYDYVKKWTSDPDESSSFKHPEGHSNPSLPYGSESKRAANAKVGVFSIDMASIKLPGSQNLALNKELVNLPETAVTPTVPAISPASTQATATGSQQALTPGAVPFSNGPGATPAVGDSAETGKPVLAGSSYIFISRNPGSTIDNPQVGDIRVSYSVLNSGINGTVFGKVNNNTFTAYSDKDGNRLFEIYQGSKEEAETAMHQSYVMWKWIMRGVGFLMMWIGLSMMLGPIGVLADVLPILGTISRSLVGLITFIVALVLSSVTILISMLLHNVVAVVLAVLVVIGAVFFFLKNKKPGAPAAPPGPGK